MGCGSVKYRVNGGYQQVYLFLRLRADNTCTRARCRSGRRHPLSIISSGFRRQRARRGFPYYGDLTCTASATVYFFGVYPASTIMAPECQRARDREGSALSGMCDLLCDNLPLELENLRIGDVLFQDSTLPP